MFVLLMFLGSFLSGTILGLLLVSIHGFLRRRASGRKFVWLRFLTTMLFVQSFSFLLCCLVAYLLLDALFKTNSFLVFGGPVIAISGNSIIVAYILVLRAQARADSVDD